MAQLELPLPELLVEDFHQGWMHFEFVAVAKEWDAVKQLAVIPTLLRGKLIDYYVELSNKTKSNLGRLKAALQERSGAKEDPVMIGDKLERKTIQICIFFLYHDYG